MATPKGTTRVRVCINNVYEIHQQGFLFLKCIQERLTQLCGALIQQ